LILYVPILVLIPSVPNSNRQLKPLTRLIGLTQSLCRISKSPYQFNWYMSNAIDLYLAGESGAGSREAQPRRPEMLAS
jgi:hypothetical protein